MTAETLGLARYITTITGRWSGEARVYMVDPPVEYEGGKKTGYVIVSATTLPSLPGYGLLGYDETYIFPAHKDGDTFEVSDWMELDGSYRGELNHEQALLNAGYQIMNGFLYQ